jgi:hypothetical protein
LANLGKKRAANAALKVKQGENQTAHKIGECLNPGALDEHSFPQKA